MNRRGMYGPLDRDRHPMVGWGVDHAADYARDRTVGAVFRPALPVIDLASRTSRGASNWWTGSQGLGGRVGAEKPLAVIGQEFYHSVADRERALSTLSTYFRVLSNDLATWQTANKDAPVAATSAQWLEADVTPTLEEWKKFAENQGAASWWTKAATSWQTYEEWWGKLRQLRALARAHGILLQSPEPVPLPKTIWEQGAAGKGSEATALLGVLKVGVFAALTIMGAATLISVVRDLKKPRVVVPSP